MLRQLALLSGEALTRSGVRARSLTPLAQQLRGACTALSSLAVSCAADAPGQFATSPRTRMQTTRTPTSSRRVRLPRRIQRAN